MNFTPGKSKQIYLIFISLLVLAACGKRNKVDVSNIDVNVTIHRFDKSFDSLRISPMGPKALMLQQRYGTFYPDFIQRILQAGSIKDTAYLAVLRKVFATSAYKDLKHEVDSVYPNLDKQDAELTDAFRRIKYYFPKKDLPKVYCYVSGFQAQTAIGNGYAGIGLDLFLGARSKFYPAIIENFPHYISRFFTPENIAPRLVEGILREDMFAEPTENKTMLQKMIYEGKIMYAMDLLLPDVTDSIKMRYTTAQLNWATKFKPQIWGYFLEENLVYSSDVLKNQQYFNDAPFTIGLGVKNESAPRLGTWTGWQIVRAYMDRHPDVSLSRLIANQDAQGILNESKYRPK